MSMADPRKEARKQAWLQMFQRPETQAALLQFGIAALQPSAPGVGTGASLANALGEGAQAAGRVADRRAGAEQQALANQMAQQEMGLRERGVAVQEQGLQQEGELARERMTQQSDLAAAELAFRSQEGEAERDMRRALAAAEISAAEKRLGRQLNQQETLAFMDMAQRADLADAENRLRAAGIRTDLILGEGRNRTAALSALADMQGPAGQEAPFGKGLEGLMRGYAQQWDTYLRAGQEPPEDVKRNARSAMAYFSQPRTETRPDGSILRVEPGWPEGLYEFTENPSQALTQEVISEEVIKGPRRGSLRPTGEPGTVPPRTPQISQGQKEEQIQESPQAIGLEQTLDTIEGTADILSQQGGAVAGMEGTAKATFGGFARQLGFPVGMESETVARNLERIKMMAAPRMLQEQGKTISDVDRARLDRVLPTLTWGNDYQSIAHALREVYAILSKYEE